MTDTARDGPMETIDGFETGNTVAPNAIPGNQTDTAMSMAWEAIIGWHGNLSDDEKEALTGRALTELKESLATVITARIAQLETDRAADPAIMEFVATSSRLLIATRIAQLEARCERMARADKAVADLREIAHKGEELLIAFAEGVDWTPEKRAAYELFARALAPYRVETDPLVEAWTALWPEDTGIPSVCAALRAELAKRGVVV